MSITTENAMRQANMTQHDYLLGILDTLKSFGFTGEDHEILEQNAILVCTMLNNCNADFKLSCEFFGVTTG